MSSKRKKNLKLKIKNSFDYDKKLFDQNNSELKNKNLTSLFPSLNDSNFNIKIAHKKEFNDTKIPSKTEEDFNNIIKLSNNICNQKDFQLAPQQMFVRNFMSFETPYNSLLVFHGLGTGKTCSSINVCEETRTYFKQLGIKKKIIIVASPNVLENFKLQLFDPNKLEKIGGLWNIKACIGNKFLKEINPMNIKGISKQKITYQIKNIIRKSYMFVGYTGFANYISNISKKFKLQSDDDDIQKQKKINAIKKEFNERLVVIDEVQNIRNINLMKRTSENFLDLVIHADNMKLLLLSATPLYNNYEEIIWLLNLMNANDNRYLISTNEIFNKDGSFKKNGREILIQKSIGYISYVKGENPFSFPYKIYPNDYKSPQSIKNTNYISPIFQINGLKIKQNLKYLDLFISNTGNEQEKIYFEFIKWFKINHKELQEKRKGIAYTVVQPPLQILNIAYPDTNIDNSDFNDYHFLYGIKGIKRLMTFDKKTMRNFNYKKSSLKNYGQIFSPNNIQKYSGKIHNIISQIKKSNGIILIYSQFLAGGCLPIALALESIGITRYGSEKSLFEKKPVNNFIINENPAKYVMITGDKKYSKNNKKELEACTNNNNNGENVKVIIISKAGNEGLDFKNIRQVHLLEPWYNLNTLDQTIGRAIRNQSHCALPFNNRNCQIFLYGSHFLNHSDVEPIDLYMYRYAEHNAELIGNVLRVLKENSIDCLINQGQNYKTNKEVEQIISSGELVNYKLQSKDYSLICDLMKCDFKCNLLSSYHPSKINKNSYNYNFMVMNIDKIKQRINQLFKEQYVYKKNNLIQKINAVRNYDNNQIMNALNTLIHDKNEYIEDMLGNIGKLVNKGEYYMFQPIDLVDNENITTMQRKTPIPFSHDKISFSLPKKIKQFETDPYSIDLLEEKYTQLVSEKKINLTRNKNWIDNANTAIHNLTKYNNIDITILNQLAMDHIIDSLKYEEKLVLLNKLNDLDNNNPFHKTIYNYFNKHIFDNFIIFYKKNKINIEFLEENDGNWGKVNKISNFNKSLTSKYFIDDWKNTFNQFIGFLIIEDNTSIFKVKNIALNSSGRKTKGKQCNKGQSKKKVFDDINMITKIINGNKKYIINQNGTKILQIFDNKIEEKIGPFQLCVELELLLRYADYQQINDKRWFFSTNENFLYDIPNLPSIKKNTFANKLLN
jgi:hypothetical protein